VAGPDIAACDPRLDTFATQHSGTDRLAVRQYLVRAEGGVAGADEVSLRAWRQRDPLPEVQLAVRGLGGWRPVAIDDVAAGLVRCDHAADIARRRDEPRELGYLAVGRCRADQLLGLFGVLGDRPGASGLRDDAAAIAGDQRQHRGESGNRRTSTQHHGATITRCKRIGQVLPDSGRQGPAC